MTKEEIVLTRENYIHLINSCIIILSRIEPDALNSKESLLGANIEKNLNELKIELQKEKNELFR